mgnify:CR=1 FL=1
MKVNNISKAYPQSFYNSHKTQFKGNFISKAKKGLVPLVLAGGMMMAQPVKADNMENFYPEAEVEFPAGSEAMNFLKYTAIACAAILATVKISELFSDMYKKDKDTNNNLTNS